MQRFLRQHVGLRYGLWVGMVGLIQIAAVAVLMLSHHDAVLSLQQTQAARDQCFAQHQIGSNTYVGIESCPQGSTTAEIDTLASDISNSYALSLLLLFVLYVLAGRAALRASGRMRAAVGAAVVAALVGGVIYILADTLRAIALFSPFVIWEPLAIDTYPPYAVGLGDEITTLLFWLAFLCLCALPLGLLGGALASQRTGEAS
jgi:hypothetical protein